MEHDKKLAFIANMADKALQHVASTPNVISPKGTMSHEKMLSFVTAMTKHGLENFDNGGVALAGPTVAGPAQNTTTGGLNGAIGNFLGTNNKFQAQGAPIQAGTNVAQLDNAYGQSQGALGAQNNIATTLNGGLARGASTQGTLGDMYLAQARGEGPNPAVARLNQATGQNIQQQAALAAGQRGAGANAGLIARQNAQQGAATQQQAVGQAATTEAEQQLAAEQNLQNLSANEIAQGTGATQTLNSATQNEQNILQGSNTANNNANVAMQSNINNVNAGVSTANQNNGNNILGGIGNAVSSVAGFIGDLFAEGGEVKKDDMPWNRKPKMMAGGGITGMATAAPQSYAGQWLNSSVDSQGPGAQPLANINTNINDPFSKKSKSTSASPAEEAPIAIGDDTDPMIAPMDIAGGQGEMPMPGADMGTLAYKGGLMKSGGKVNAPMANEKAVKSGDSLSNDKVPAMLSEGEIVIPRHITMGPNAPARAAQFVAQQLAKRGKR